MDDINKLLLKKLSHQVGMFVHHYLEENSWMCFVQLNSRKVALGLEQARDWYGDWGNDFCPDLYSYPRTREPVQELP